MEDNVAISRIGMMAVLVPATGAKVEFDIAAENVSASFDSGVAVIGPGRAAGNPREDDPKAAAIFEAGLASDAGGPAGSEGRLTASHGRRELSHRVGPDRRERPLRQAS